VSGNNKIFGPPSYHCRLARTNYGGNPYYYFLAYGPQTGGAPVHSAKLQTITEESISVTIIKRSNGASGWFLVIGILTSESFPTDNVYCLTIIDSNGNVYAKTTPFKFLPAALAEARAASGSSGYAGMTITSPPTNSTVPPTFPCAGNSANAAPNITVTAMLVPWDPLNNVSLGLPHV
jgi:hypothetical protein